MRSYVVQFCNRAAKDAKEINVFFRVLKREILQFS